MKNILIAIPNLSGGGAEKVLIDILNNIDRSKFKIDLLVFNKGKIYDEKVPNYVNFISIDEKIGFIPVALRERIRWYFPRIFYRLIINKKYDTEIAFMEGIATRFISYSNNKKSKKIAWVHIDMKKKHWTKSMYKCGEESRCYSKFNDIVFVSKNAKSAFNEIFIENKVNKRIIYNPIIDVEVIKKSNEFKVDFKDFTIISLGRLDTQKGYDRLIKVHASLVNKFPHKIIILGEGGERESLEKIIKDYGVEKTFKLNGFVNNPYPYLKAANLFVSSSRYEGYPLVVCESIVLEKAILATNITGNNEILNNGEYGLLCDDSVDGIKGGLEMLLRNTNLIKEYEYRSKLGRNKLNYKQIIKEIEDIL